MIPILLIQKISSLFIILLLGLILTKCRIVNTKDSRTLSALSVYLMMPCVILSAFQVDFSPSIQKGLLLAVLASVCVHIIFIVFSLCTKNILHLDTVEQMSLIYSNAGNLVIPLVQALLGSEWVIYSSAYVAVQLVFLWSHGASLLIGRGKMNLRKILLNINMISVLAGTILLLTGIRLPAFVNDALGSLGNMVGPSAMLIAGMLLGRQSLRHVLSFHRVWLVTALRLIICPLLLICFCWAAHIKTYFGHSPQILMLVFLAASTPSASSITQMAQVYDKNADYAGVINIVTTLFCIISMPCLIMLFQAV